VSCPCSIGIATGVVIKGVLTSPAVAALVLVAVRLQDEFTTIMDSKLRTGYLSCTALNTAVRLLRATLPAVFGSIVTSAHAFTRNLLQSHGNLLHSLASVLVLCFRSRAALPKANGPGSPSKHGVRISRNHLSHCKEATVQTTLHLAIVPGRHCLLFLPNSL